MSRQLLVSLRFYLMLMLSCGLSGCGFFFRAPLGPVPSVEELHARVDEDFQAQIEFLIDELDLRALANRNRLGLAVLDISDPKRQRLAGVNLDSMMYAASLPKIAILYAALKKSVDENSKWSKGDHELAVDMIQRSGNETASQLFRKAGPDFITSLLQSDEFRFYDSNTGGGLWVGKEYSKASAWKRDPLLRLSHAATPLQVVRFYYALESGNLLPANASGEMKEVMSKSYLPHKFIKGMLKTGEATRYLRKSGSWGNYHSDSILVEDRKKRFILVALLNDPHGVQRLEQLFVKVRAAINDPQRGTRLVKALDPLKALETQ